MSTAELGLSLAEMIRRDKVHAHLLHRRQPRGGRLQPGRPRPLRAHPRLPGPDAGRRDRRCSSRQPQPGHRHLHPRGGGHARASSSACSSCGSSADAAGRAATSRTSSSTRLLRERRCSKTHYQIDPKDSLDAGRRGDATCRCSCRAGRTRRSATSSRPRASTATSSNVAHGADAASST